MQAYLLYQRYYNHKQLFVDMNQMSCKIDAFWDVESEVWVATSEAVPGLATEAATLEALAQKLRLMLPELLQMNDVIPENQVSAYLIMQAGLSKSF